MNGKQEKRKLKGYKVKDSLYQKAKRRAIRDKTTLAQIIEEVVVFYASGHRIVIEPPQSAIKKNTLV